MSPEFHHADGSDTVTVNQQQSGGQWNLLGTYTLDNNSTLTLSSKANGYVIADGIRLVTTTTGTSSGVYYVHNDHLGTPQTLTDNNQDIVWAAAYDPFGKATVTTETVTNNVRFPGQYFDQETGLHYNYFRTYDPSTGRYITSDPIGLDGGMNTYVYVKGNPLFWADPQGLFEVQAHQNRGGGNGWETKYNFNFSPLDESAGKWALAFLKFQKKLNLAMSAIDFLDTEPVGPLHPFKDFVQCGFLDKELEEEFKEMFGDDNNLTPEQALDFLTGAKKNHPEFKDLYPSPVRMLDKAERNSKDHWQYKMNP